MAVKRITGAPASTSKKPNVMVIKAKPAATTVRSTGATGGTGQGRGGSSAQSRYVKR